MMREFVFLVLSLVTLASANVIQQPSVTAYLEESTVRFNELPLPRDVALEGYLDEDGFEDYLDFWLSEKYKEEHIEEENKGSFRGLFIVHFIFSITQTRSHVELVVGI
jgi:hypothetical protein